MAIKAISMARFNGGIAIGDKETITSAYNQNGLNSSYRFGYGLNVHDEPSKLSVLPGTANVLSGAYGQSVTEGQSGIIDEPRWIVTASPYIPSVFMYGSTGAIYQETPGGWIFLRKIPNSVGQGMVVFQDYLYYVQNTQIGRYGPLDNNPTWNDVWQTGLNNTAALGFAPCLVFGYGVAFCNGNQVSFYGTGGGTTLSFQLSALTFPAGTNCISVCRIEQYMAIGTTGSTSVFDNEQGYIFLWDGSSQFFNFFNNIEQGANNCIANYRNQPLSINGIQGMIYMGYDPFIKTHQLPNLPITGSCQVYPGAISSWKGRIYIGMAANSADPNFTRGVYAWGAKVNAYPDSLTCDYLISTGNKGATVQITAVTGLGNSLYIGWRDGNTVGVDKVRATNNPLPSARIDFLVFDDGRMPQRKKADTIKVDHSPLNPGESISIYVRADRVGNYTTPVFTHSYNAAELNGVNNVTRFSPPTGLSAFREYELGVGITCTGSTTPYIYGVSMKYDDLSNELAI